MTGVLVARALGPMNRGYLALLILWPTVIARLGGLGVPLALPYFVAKQPKSAYSLVRRLARPVLVQFAVLALLHAIVLAVFLSNKEPAVRIAGLVTLVGVPNNLGLEYGLGLLQGQQRFRAFNILRAVPNGLFAIAAIGLFVGGTTSLINIAIALALSGLIAAITALATAFRGLKRFSGEPAVSSRELLGFGLRGLMGAVSPVETLRLDQAVIGLFLSPAALGLYIVGLAFTNLPRLLSQSIGVIAYPHIAAKSEDDAWVSVRRFFGLAMLIVLPTVIAIEVAAGFLVPFFFGHAFAAAIGVTRLLLIGGLFLAARRILTDGARGAGHPGVGTIAEIASWVGLVPGILILTPRWGVVGVAWAFVIAAAIGLLALLLALRLASSRRATDRTPELSPLRSIIEPRRA